MTPQQQAAMRQALEALIFGLHVGFDESSESQIKKGGKAFDQHNKAITALRQALEKQPCNYPNCPYPCPDLPDCKDEEDLYDLAVKADNGGQP